MPDVELLHDAGEENEKLFFGQRLAEAVALAQPEWNDVIVMNEFSIFVNKPFRVEDVRILEQFGIVHGVVEAGHHCGTLKESNYF